MYLMRKKNGYIGIPLPPSPGLKTGNTFSTVYSVIGKVNHWGVEISYRRKIHCLACCPSPPLWHAHLSSDPTHWGSLISYPVYGHISTWLALVKTRRHHASSKLFDTHIFNPRHSSIVDIVHVPGINVINSYLHLDGFVGIEHEWS